MGESESFSSLMDLVNSHLSKTSLTTSQEEESNSAFTLSSVRIQTGKSQTVFTPPNGIMAIPRLGPQDNEITDILAQQVTNMLIAKEKKKQEDEQRQKLEEENRILKQQKKTENYDIDLMSSIILPKEQKVARPIPPKLNAKIASSSESIDSLLAEVKMPGNKTVKELEKPFVILPLNRDMSYMLYRKVGRAKPSAFGKVISARLRPVAAPYLKVEINNAAVKRFDFSTKSPCDINLEKRRNPAQDPYYANMNMVERFMAQTNNEGMLI